MDIEVQDMQIKRVEKYCKEHSLFGRGDGIVIGVSGGADSVFLLHFLAAIREKWNLRLCVVHVNHGIRGDAAKEDQEYVRKLAGHFEIPIEEYEAEIPALAKEWKMTEEEAGRVYRYQCFENVRKAGGFTRIAVAHHKDDQAETVLFQLFRGSGLRGLGGMYPKREHIIRPLLDLTKDEILETLEKYDIKYCRDDTNEESEYDRNRIRNELFPWIEDTLQHRVQCHIAKSASYLQEVMSYIDEQTELLLPDLVKREENGLAMECHAFSAIHVALQRELIIRMVEMAAGRKKDITGEHIENIRQIFMGETGKRIMLPYGLIARKEYGTLILERKKEEEPFDFVETELVCGKSYEIPYTNGERKGFLVTKTALSEINQKKYCTKCFDYDKIKSVVLFRNPFAGDYLWLDKEGKKKKLSRIFIDEKIPAERRKKFVVLAEGNHILWIPELGRCSAYYYLSEHSENVISICERV